MAKRVILKVEGKNFLVPAGKDLGVLVQQISEWQTISIKPKYGEKDRFIVDEPNGPEIVVVIADDSQIEIQDKVAA